MTKVYRLTGLGVTLEEALDELVSAGKLSGELATKMMEKFDAVMCKALPSMVDNRVVFRGKLDTYRYCDSVWTFIVSNASFRPMSATQYLPLTHELHADKLKLVCVDQKLGQGVT